MEDVVTVHYSRLEVVNVSLDDNSTRQFAVDTMLRAADQLAQAKVDAIIWNGTAGSWLGIERDREMCQKIEEKTKIPMSTASLGLVESYQDFDIKRLHLVTPYIKEMNDAIIREYEKLGLTAAGVTGLGIHGKYRDRQCHEGTAGDPVLQHRRRPWRGDCSCLYEPGCCLESGLDRKNGQERLCLIP